MKEVSCKGSINGWVEDIYYIDRENETSRKYAIWRNNQWCVSNIKSVKNALIDLKEEFVFVSIINN